MPDLSPTEAADQLPPGLFEQLRTPLMLVHVVCRHLFYYPDTALCREVVALTGLDAGFVATMHAVSDEAALQAVMQQQPLPFLWYVRLGQQLLSSTLGQQLLDRLQEPPTEETEMAAAATQTRALLDHFLQWLHILAEYFTPYALARHEDAPDLELGLLQLEGMVARQLHSLPPLPYLSDPTVTTGVETEPESEVVAYLTFEIAQLQVMRLATTLPDMLPDALSTAFTRGIAAVAAFRTPLLGQLRQRLMAATPDEPLGFTLAELALLFRCAQVCAMTMLQPELELLLLNGVRLDTDEDPDATSRVRHVLSAIVGGFVALMQRQYGQMPEFEQAQREMDGLADLL